MNTKKLEKIVRAMRNRVEEMKNLREGVVSRDWVEDMVYQLEMITARTEAR